MAGRCSGPGRGPPPASTTELLCSPVRPTGAVGVAGRAHQLPARSAWAWHVEVRNDWSRSPVRWTSRTPTTSPWRPGHAAYKRAVREPVPRRGAAPRGRLRHGASGAPELRPGGPDPVVRGRLTTPVGALVTDALHAHGLAARAGGPPRPRRRPALPATPARAHPRRPADGTAAAGARSAPGDSFAGLLVAHHPAAMSHGGPLRPAGAGPRPLRGLGPPRRSCPTGDRRRPGSRPPPARTTSAAPCPPGRPPIPRSSNPGFPWRAVERHETARCCRSSRWTTSTW